MSKKITLTKNKITLAYHSKSDLIYSILVILCGESCSAYVWTKISELSNQTLDCIFASVFLGFLGLSFLFISIRSMIREKQKSKIFHSQFGITVVNYTGKVLNNCRSYYIRQGLIQKLCKSCDLILVDFYGKKLKIKNVSIDIINHL